MKNSIPQPEKTILHISAETLPHLSEVERLFLDKFIREGRAVIVKEES